jgi:hypothetical protein
MFRVGQKIVCIVAPAPIHETRHLCDALPRKGVIYTVRAVVWADKRYSPGQHALLLAEIRNPVRRDSGAEPNFHVALFRPLVDTEQEISFTVGADPSSKRFDNRRKQKAAT